MLLRFGVSNYLSIAEYQEISCAAAVGLKDDCTHLLLYKTPRNSSKYFVPVIALYGANAAGKSNMIDALGFMVRTVRRSFNPNRESRSLKQFYCYSDESFVNKPSEFDCDFLVEDVRYTYGFSIKGNLVVEEWLHSYSSGQRRSVFERNFTTEEGKISGALISKLDASLKKRVLDDSSLFLSSAGALQFEPLITVFNFFRDYVSFVSANDIPVDSVIAKDLSDKKVKLIIEDFLRKADPGLVGLKITQKRVDPQQKMFQAGIGKLIKQVMGEEISLPQVDTEPVIKFVHQRPEGSVYEILKIHESSGTKQLLSLLVPIISTLRRGGIVVLDEITTALHTHLSKELIRLFSSNESNPNGAQLIFSTHDTNLLSCGELRRDQVWFAEKDPSGKTCIYPLTDFKVRKSENIEKGYLQGRFGAIPFFGGITGILSRRKAFDKDA